MRDCAERFCTRPWSISGTSLRARAHCTRWVRKARIALARESIAHALDVAQRRASGLLDPYLLRREAVRDERLLELLIEWELAREPFAIEMLERSLPLDIAGTRLGVRMDRVDRLADGQLMVIDYKSGDAASFDALAIACRSRSFPLMPPWQAIEPPRSPCCTWDGRA